MKKSQNFMITELMSNIRWLNNNVANCRSQKTAVCSNSAKLYQH